MVFTVEPGLYFRPGVADEQAAGFAGIGVRIEDDVAVTADGRENLTAGLPTAAGDVEELVGAGA
jgi:Xaa-Pro aminopeptidase